MINWDRVDELRDDFGEEDFLEITTLFLAEVQGKLDELSQDSDPDLAEGFHFLKGGAANLGFTALQDASAEAETDPSPERLDKIQQIFWASKAAFLTRIGTAGEVA